MPIPISVEKLLDGTTVESARIEFKEGWNPESIIHTVCAFANDIDNWGGGYIVIGAAEESGVLKRPLVGVDPERLDDIQKELLNLCSKIQPKYMPICEPVEYENAWLLIVWVPGGYDRPYSAPISPLSRKSDRARYVRRFSSTKRSNAAEERELVELGGRVPFDDRVNHQARIEDLEIALMDDFLRTVNSSIETLPTRDANDLAQMLRVVGGPSENLQPLNVGLLMFSSDPEKYLPHTRIEVVEIPEATGSGMTERVFRGPINRQLVDALAFIKNYVIAERIFKVEGQAEAVRVFNYPYKAIEEALSNAVLHRGYNEYEPITVRIEPGQLSILSVPGPDRSIQDKDIRRNRLVSKRYRNRRVGEFLKELGLIEGRNTGVPTMLKALEDNGSEPPVFATDDDRTYFEVIFKEHELFHEDDNEEKTSINGTQEASRAKRRNRQQLRDDSLVLLREKDMSQNELAAALGYQGVSKTLTEVIQALIEEGELALTGREHSPNTKLHRVKKSE